MAGAFQPDAFQNSAFQSSGAVVVANSRPRKEWREEADPRMLSAIPQIRSGRRFTSTTHTWRSTVRDALRKR